MWPLGSPKMITGRSLGLRFDQQLFAQYPQAKASQQHQVRKQQRRQRRSALDEILQPVGRRAAQVRRRVVIEPQQTHHGLHHYLRQAPGQECSGTCGVRHLNLISCYVQALEYIKGLQFRITLPGGANDYDG